MRTNLRWILTFDRHSEIRVRGSLPFILIVAGVVAQRQKMKHVTSARYRSVVIMFILACIPSISGKVAQAQVTTADVLGTVTDTTGAVVPGAKVTLSNTATGVVSSVESNGTGDYIFNLLTPGHYSVAIEAPGYKKVVFVDVALAAGDRAREDGVLQAGAVEETVQVTSAPMCATTPAFCAAMWNRGAP